MKKPKFIPEFRDIPSARQKMPELPTSGRECNFEEVELGLTEEMVLKEAARCLSCRRCIGCGLCLAECEPDAIVYDETGQKIEIGADAVIFTSDGQAFDAGRKRSLGYRESANVITSFEFERLVSPTGPFGGFLLRPSDGDVPRRLAFIQCVGSREEGIGANYCSVECCSRTLTQARRAGDLLGRVDVRVFHRGLRPIGKRSELELEGLRSEKWIRFTEAAVTSVTEDAESGTVTIAFEEGGEPGEDNFDLVVLAVGVQSMRPFKRFARVAGAQTNKFGFVERKLGSMIGAANGVAFAGAISGPTSAGQSMADAIAAASRSLGSSAEEADKIGAGSGGKPVIFACEYGLGLSGKDRSLVDKLTGDGYPVQGPYPYLCYMDGRRAMAEKLGDAAGVVVVGCHAGSHEELFERLLGLPTGRVVVLGGDELDGDAAKSLDTAEETLRSNAASPGVTERPRRVVVVGGGVAGLAAAGELSRRGLEVVVVEKSGTLGESLREAAIAEGADPEAIDGFIKGIETGPGVRVMTSAELVRVTRSNGRLSVTASTEDGEQAIECGALLVATGGDAYRAEEFPLGVNEAVLTQRDFGSRVIKGEKPWKRIVMIQCVGARDAEHPYCSRFCCREAIANASLYKSNNPDAEITILHRGIRVYGAEEDLYTDAIEQGVEFIEIGGKPEVVTGKPLKVSAGSRAGEAISLESDLVVLSIAHHHGQEQRNLAEIAGVPLDDLNFFEARTPLADPFATAVDGVFACGFARAPMVAEDAFVDGVGAAGAICRYI